MTWTRRFPVVLAVGIVVTVAACTSDDGGQSAVSSLASPSTTTTSFPAATVTTTTSLPPTTTSVAAVVTSPPAPPTTSATSTSTSTTLPATTTTVAAGAALSLRLDGLGDARFGDAPDQVLSYVTGVLGDPAEDSGWVDAISRSCPGTQVRLVRWGDLSLQFGDESNVASGRRHFASWSFGPATDVTASPAGLLTAERIGIGSSVSAIGRAYPDATLFEGDELVTASAHIDDGLIAFLTDTADFGVITAMIGGQGCGE